MSKISNTSTENQLSNEILGMKNLLNQNESPEQGHPQTQKQIQDQGQLQTLKQQQNEEETENQLQIETQDQAQTQEQNQDVDQTQNQESNINHDANLNNDKDNKEEGEEDPTKNIFATNNDNIDLLVPSKKTQTIDENLNENIEESTPNDKKPLFKSQFQIKKPTGKISRNSPLSKQHQHAVLTFLDEKPKNEKKKTLESIIHVQSPTHNFTPEEISQITDSFLKSDKVQLEDPMIVSEIIEELTSRYIDHLSKNEYIQAQNVQNKIIYLRDQFRTKDAVLFMEKHLDELKSKKSSLENELKSIRAVWKEKQKKLDESYKKETEELQVKQQELWDKMEKDWTDPSRQRKYSKESKTLLLSRAAERYMVLAGDLEGAEIMKRKNKQLERIETAEAYSEMASDYENARAKLTKYFERQENDLEEQHKIKKISLKNDELEEIELIRKKIDILEKMISDESNPTYKEKKIIHSRLVNSAELPMLQRTAQNIRDKNKLFMKTAQVTTKPLQLPPLKMVPRQQKKSKSNLSRPIAH